MAARLLQVVVSPYRGCSFTAVTRVQIPNHLQIPSRILWVRYGPISLGAWFFFILSQLRFWPAAAAYSR